MFCLNEARIFKLNIEEKLCKNIKPHMIGSVSKLPNIINILFFYDNVSNF